MGQMISNLNKASRIAQIKDYGWSQVEIGWNNNLGTWFIFAVANVQLGQYILLRKIQIYDYPQII